MRFEESVELDHMLVDLESLTFVVRGVIDRLCERLACRALAAAALTVRLALDPKGIHEIDLPLRVPTRDVATLTTLSRLAVAAAPPDREIVGVTVTARAAPPVTDQLALFEPVPPRPEAIAATLARLAAVVGSDRVGAPEIQDSHRPEAWRLVPFAPPRTRDQPSQLDSTAEENGRGAQADARGHSPRHAARWRSKGTAAAHRVREASAAALRFRSTERGAALALRWLAETEEIDPLRRTGGTNVVEHAGPWRLEVEWWGPSAGAKGARDYYTVRTSDGLLHLVFKQGEFWRRAGVFD
jgi:protein ImuB